jgi:tetratricopeptide (TPR) repeat protein
MLPPESIEISLKGISCMSTAQDFGVDGSVQSVLQWISSIQEEWLIVFDNADDLSPEAVANFFPPGNRGNILITSRNQSMGRIVTLLENSIEVNEMEESDAITLLLRASCLNSLDEHIEAAREIVVKLGCIPLAVDHAGAYIAAGKCNINTYLRLFFLHRQTLMTDVTFRGASNYNQTVYGTWDLSFKQIEQRARSTIGNAEAAQAAILILQICAFYHHSNISKEIFRSAAEKSRKHDVDTEVAEKLPHAITSLDHTLLALDNNGQWDEFVFGQGIGVLLSFSLMRKEHLSEMFSFHPLVHYWSREQMMKSAQQQMCEMGSTILSCAIPLRFTSQDYILRRLIFPHIKANELHGIQMGLIRQYYDDKFSNFSLVLWENGDWDTAEQLQDKIVEMRKKLLGTEHSDTLLSMRYLARTYSDQGRWNEAEQLELQVMDIGKKWLGPEDPLTLVNMGNLAGTYCNQGRWNEAEQLQLQVMDKRKKLLGPEHPLTLVSMGNLAGTYCNQGRWNEAEQLELQVMDIRKKLHGPENPDTLVSMGNLARTYFNQGRWNKAEQLELQVMDMRKKLLGPEHPDTLLIMGNLARTYCDQGRWNEAEQLELQVMDIRKKLHGPEHQDTLLTMGNLASTYCNQGRWNEAEQLQLQVVDIRNKLLGPEHPDTLVSMGNLASIYFYQGRWNEAEQLELQVTDMRKKLLGPKHPHTLLSIGNLARIYCNQGRWNEAEQLELQVMDISKKLLGLEHPDTLFSMGNLASTYFYQGRWSEAEQLELQVMDMRKKLLGSEHPATLLSIGNLARIYSDQGRWNEAEQLELQVMDISKNLPGTEHSDIFKSMERLTRIKQSGMKQKRWSFKLWIKKMRRVLKNSITFSKYKNSQP